MRKNRAALIGLSFLVLVPLSLFEPLSAQGASPRLARVVYLTTSKACSCTLELCKAADGVVALVFADVRQPLLQRLDYARDKTTSRDYIRKYHLYTIPALLFLDAQGNLLWSAVGKLHKEEIIKQLNQFGS